MQTKGRKCRLESAHARLAAPQQAAVLGAGGLGGLLALLAATEPARREAAADALATLLSGSPAAASEVGAPRLRSDK